MNSYKKQLAQSLVFIINGFAKLLGSRFYNIFLDQITNGYHHFNKNINIDINGKKTQFVCPNRLTKWRLETFFTKEPATLTWINSFSKDSILWDIGANIGLYSIYAAITQGIKVFSFEPLPSNYAALCENILLNNLSENISAFPIALNNKSFIGNLNAENRDTGSSFCSFDASPQHQFKRFPLIGYSIDEFIEVFKLDIPSHIKIDVDGIEEKILHGATHTLKNPALQSISIEVDESKPDELESITNILCHHGFELISSHRSPLFPNSPFHNLHFNKR